MLQMDLPQILRKAYIWHWQNPPLHNLFGT